MDWFDKRLKEAWKELGKFERGLVWLRVRWIRFKQIGMLDHQRPPSLERGQSHPTNSIIIGSVGDVIVVVGVWLNIFTDLNRAALHLLRPAPVPLVALVGPSVVALPVILFSFYSALLIRGAGRAIKG